jgi:hypothetical protein
MTNFNRVATLALGLLTIASTAPALAQPNGDRTNGRAAAIRECNRAATPYRQYLWGDFEIDVVEELASMAVLHCSKDSTHMIFTNGHFFLQYP